MIERTVKDLIISDIKNSSLIINDIGSKGKGYGYGGKYEYGYDYANVYGKEKR